MSKLTKVLFLSPLPPPHYGSAISSEACLKILKGSKEFDVRSIKLNYSREMSDVGHINLSKVKGFFHVLKEIKRILASFNPDIIYFVPATSGLGLARDYRFFKRVRKLSNARIIFHVRSRITKKDRESLFFRGMYQKMFQGNSAIVLGKSLIGDVKGLVQKDKLCVLPNAIENEISGEKLKRITRARAKRESFSVLFLSNMDKAKGWLKLLQACSILKSRGIEFQCNFAGEWPGNSEEKQFFSFVNRNKLEDCVSYLGKVSGREKSELLGKSNVLVFPTEYKLETFGRVIIEAMMFGLPVVANGVATIPSIIADGKTGFILKQNSSAEIAAILENLRGDKKLRDRLGTAGRKKFLKEFEMGNYSGKFIRIIEKAAGK